MKLGFTGTRNGLTDAQAKALGELIEGYVPREAHHGCCVGADATFSHLAGHYMHTEVIGHPSTFAEFTMPDEDLDRDCDQILPPKPPLDRNRDIVDACDLLIACPEGPEKVRSGTWATIRYARKKRKPVAIIWPDGRVEEGKP